MFLVEIFYKSTRHHILTHTANFQTIQEAKKYVCLAGSRKIPFKKREIRWKWQTINNLEITYSSNNFRLYDNEYGYLLARIREREN